MLTRDYNCSGLGNTFGDSGLKQHLIRFDPSTENKLIYGLFYALRIFISACVIIICHLSQFTIITGSFVTAQWHLQPPKALT